MNEQKNEIEKKRKRREESIIIVFNVQFQFFFIFIFLYRKKEATKREWTSWICLMCIPDALYKKDNKTVW